MPIERSTTPDEQVHCPICGAFHDRSIHYILSCPNCGHRWLNSSTEDRRAVETSTFTHAYAGYRPDATYVESTTRLARAELVSRIPPPARVLDVGCGAGDFVAVMRSLGYDAEGIDISQASADICRSRDLPSCAGDFLTFEFPDLFDIITMWDVVAHLRDPFAFFTRAHSQLSDRGLLFIKTPAFGRLSVELSNFCPRAAPTLLGAPSHSQYFNRRSLSVLFDQAGLGAVWLESRNARTAASGGPLKRRLARRARRLISRLSGDSNLYVLGHIES